MDQMNLFTITDEQSQRRSYVESLRAELDVGRDISLQDISKNRINRKPILDYKARVLAGKTSAECYSDWLDPFIAQYGPRKKCLSLGSGLGRIESYLIEKGFTSAIDAIEVCADVNFNARVSERGVDFTPGDLNFLEIEPESFDFILCHGVLHHLINLELILNRINRALRSDGVILIYEYIGESRWQFSPQRMAVLQERFPRVSFSVPPLWAVPGFESVRSSDLLPLVRQHFASSCRKEVLYGGAYFPFVTCTEDQYDDLLDEVLKLDEEVTRSGRLDPCYLMGVYGKAPVTMVSARRWSDQELDARLRADVPMTAKIMRAVKRTALWRLLRSVKRRIT